MRVRQKRATNIRASRKNLELPIYVMRQLQAKGINPATDFTLTVTLEPHERQHITHRDPGPSKQQGGDLILENWVDAELGSGLTITFPKSRLIQLAHYVEHVGSSGPKSDFKAGLCPAFRRIGIELIAWNLQKPRVAVA